MNYLLVLAKTQLNYILKNPAAVYITINKQMVDSHKQRDPKSQTTPNGLGIPWVITV